MEQLGIDSKLLIAQLINFGLFFFLFQKLIAKPFLSYLQSEKKKDEEKQKAYEASLKQEEQLKQQEKNVKDQLAQEMKKNIEKAKKEAEEARKQLILDAKKEAELIIIDAKKRIDQERKTAEFELKKKAADLTITLIEDAFKNYLTDTHRKEMTQHIIENITRKSN